MSTLTITPELTARLRASGYKLTPPRLAVLQVIFGQGGHLNIHAEGGHHHLVCSLCGKVIDFDQCTADQIADDLSARYGFTIVSHLLEFYGECAECKAGAG